MRVKILGDGELKKALKITGCSVSESAKAAIEKAGGTIEIPDTKGGWTQEVKVRTSDPKDDAKNNAAAKSAAKAAGAKAPKAEKVVKVKAEKTAKPKTEKTAKKE